MLATVSKRWNAAAIERLLSGVAFGCAVVLLFAYVASKIAGDAIDEDPTGYRLLTLCGLAATVTLAIGVWQQDRRGTSVPAALAALVVFTFAAWFAATYWYSITLGDLYDRSVQPSPLLHLCALAATIGALCALALVVARRPRRGDDRHRPSAGAASDHGSNGSRQDPAP